MDGEVVRERSLAPAAALRRSAMATQLKPIAHEERLSLVEHLDELRTRLIICIVAFVVASPSACGRTTRPRIVNEPLAQTREPKPCDDTRDPLEQADCWQQAQKRVNERIARRCGRARALGRR